MSKAKLAERFSSDDANRESILQTARRCASLTKPWVLPPLNQQSDQSLPENYQSIGSRGITNLEGRMLLALHPYGAPWFIEELAPEIRFDPQVDPEQIRDAENRLFLRGAQIQATLDSANDDYSRFDGRGFRTARRSSISQLLITGDTLERMNDDYTITVFRRDKYVVKRDGSGLILYIVIKETIDPVDALTKKQYAKANLAEDWDKKPVCDRQVDLYTCSEWNPRSRSWTVTQEVNGNIVNEFSEKVSRFFCTPFDLVPGENYGRGFVEQNRGDLHSLDKLGEYLLDFAALASKHQWAIDKNSLGKPEDLLKKSGTFVEGFKVADSQVKDLAPIRADKLSDFNVVNITSERIESRLGAAMLIQSESVRQSERTTAFEVSEITIKELEGALGGFYAPIADKMQVPLFHRTVHQMVRDKKLLPLDRKFVVPKVLTGLAALTSARRSAELQGFFELATQAGPTAMARIDIGVYLEELAKARNITIPGLIKTSKQVAKEMQEAMKLQAQAQANERAIDAAGTVIETQAQQQGNANA